ncbi:MAG: hypothetical protein Q9187_001016 [Circinaria calcarea]
MSTPVESESESMNINPYLEQLAELAGPVPDFAATLTTQAELDAEEDNVSFLRTPIDTSDDRDSGDELNGPVYIRTASDHGNTGGQRSAYLSALEFRHGQRELQRRAMRRAVLHNRRYTPEQLQELGASQESLSSDLQSREHSAYRGWAPGSLDTGTGNTTREIERYLDGAARRNQREDEAAEAEIPVLRRHTGADRASNWGQSHFVEHGIGAEPTATESSLRTTALLQSVRRHARFSPRSRDHLESYILDRERARRTDQSNQELDSTATAAPQQQSTHASSTNGQLPQEQRRELLRHRVERALQDTPSHSIQNVSDRFGKAIEYLERLRYCETYTERISSAAEGGFMEGELFTDNHDDLILDTTTIGALPESSWLRAGSVFRGSQHAEGGLTPPSYRITNPTTRGSSISHRNVRSHTVRIPTSHGVPIIGYTSSLNTEDAECWPVKVTLHSVDYANMTISGTMEAFDVPDKFSPTLRSSITTYLEGEIIDFDKFTLETKTFDGNVLMDRTYWRKLDPFKTVADKELVRNTVSAKWLKEDLAHKYILMRWKERCFLSPSDEQSGLTISGFYYCSLRRSDGCIQGLYYDPVSLPYQHLSLRPEKKYFPSYAFR